MTEVPSREGPPWGGNCLSPTAEIGQKRTLPSVYLIRGNSAWLIAKLILKLELLKT